MGENVLDPSHRFQGERSQGGGPGEGFAWLWRSPSALALLFCVLVVGACCEKKTTYYCSTCLAEHGCKYCSPRTYAATESGAAKDSKQRLCGALAGVDLLGVETRDQAACLANPEAKFATKCSSTTSRQPNIHVKVENESESPRERRLAQGEEERPTIAHCGEEP